MQIFIIKTTAIPGLNSTELCGKCKGYCTCKMFTIKYTKKYAGLKCVGLKEKNTAHWDQGHSL